MSTRTFLAAAILSLMPTLAMAHDFVSDSVHIDHPWTRPTPPGSPMGAGYLTITNTGDSEITLSGATTPRAAEVSIHESIMHDGMMSMQPLKAGLAIPAGKTVELKPHSYHLMLEQLTGPLKEGESVPLTLQFDGASAVEVTLKVESLDEAGKKMGKSTDMDHSGHAMN